jgi:hypothetical protein
MPGPCSPERRLAHDAQHGDIEVWKGKLLTLSPCRCLQIGMACFRTGAGFMFDLHLPLLGLFGAGFVLDVLWRGFCDWLDQ